MCVCDRGRTDGAGCGTDRSAGLDAADLTPEQDARFWDYVTHAAQFMVNTMEPIEPIEPNE